MEDPVEVTKLSACWGDKTSSFCVKAVRSASFETSIDHGRYADAVEVHEIARDEENKEKPKESSANYEADTTIPISLLIAPNSAD